MNRAELYTVIDQQFDLESWYEENVQLTDQELINQFS